MGLGDQFEMVKEKYREANLLLGDIVKVRCTWSIMWVILVCLNIQ